MTVNPNVRSVAIVMAIAAVVAFVPGGGTTAGVVISAISLVFLTSLVWVALIMYREHRTALYALGDRRRTVAYAAVAVLVITLTGTAQLWSTPGGSVAWLLLVGAAAYALFAVAWSARRY